MTAKMCHLQFLQIKNKICNNRFNNSTSKISFLFNNNNNFIHTNNKLHKSTKSKANTPSTKRESPISPAKEKILQTSLLLPTPTNKTPYNPPPPPTHFTDPIATMELLYKKINLIFTTLSEREDSEKSGK